MTWLSEILDHANTPVDCDNEKTYRSRWVEATTDVENTFQAAVAGGLVADRIEWVFIAGYQAAIRANFPVEDFVDYQANHWLSVAVSEHKAEKGIPGVSAIVDDSRIILNGTKSWIASSSFVDALIVKAGRGEQSRCVFVPRGIGGLAITTNPEPKAMPALSQGQAIFTDVELDNNLSIERALLKSFARFEALYIFIAASASLLANARSLSTPFTAQASALLSEAELFVDDLSNLASEISAERHQEFSRKFAALYESYQQIPNINRLIGPAEKKLFSIYAAL